MKKTMQRLVAILIALALLAGCAPPVPQQSVADSAPGSPALRLTEVTPLQSDCLQLLCKVWGVAKYHHPVFVSGQRDWDAELLALLPEILVCDSMAAADTRLTAWLADLGDIPANALPDLPDMETTMGPDLGWLTDGAVFPALAAAVTALLDSNLTDRTNAPAFVNEQGMLSLQNEKSYDDMDAADAGLRLLGLFRYWNVIAYYYPYHPIPGEDWEQVLADFIPRFLQGDGLSYKQAVAELSTRIHDSHSVTFDKTQQLFTHYGSYLAPFEFLVLDGQVVVSGIPTQLAKQLPVQLGDVITAIDGVPTATVIAERLTRLSLSNDARLTNALAGVLLRSQTNRVELTLLRDGAAQTVAVRYLSDWSAKRTELPSHELLGNNLARLNPGFLEKGELATLMPQLMDTDGLIVDLRQYPSDFITYSLAEYLLPQPAAFARMSVPHPARPGYFLLSAPLTCGKQSPDYYRGKVVLLMDERTQSNAEFTVMALRQAPGAVVVGSASIGADGARAELPMPGGVTASFTSQGVYTPEGGATQRVGLSPDIEVKPTVQGLRQGRDELLESAVAILLKK